MTRQWINAGAVNDWYNAANWTPPTPAGAWLPADTAEFNNTGTATLAAIDMSAGNLTLGAISIMTRARDLTIGNSSPVAGIGQLQLNGATVKGLNNVVLSIGTSLPPYTLFLEDKLSGMLGHMEIVLGNSTENIFLLDNEMSAVQISAPISGAGKNLTLGMKPAGGTTGVLTLSGANTYTGMTTIKAGRGSIVLARFGGNTLPPTNDVDIQDGSLIIKSNQTLRNVKLSGLGSLKIDPGVILTITGKLDNGPINVAGGKIKGTVVFV